MGIRRAIFSDKGGKIIKKKRGDRKEEIISGINYIRAEFKEKENKRKISETKQDWKWMRKSRKLICEGCKKSNVKERWQWMKMKGNKRMGINGVK